MGNITIDLGTVATAGLDLAKHIFQVHAVDAAGHVVTNRALRRKDVLAFFESLPRCLIGLEACGSAHHWARELMKFGHDVRLMPPAYVKAYVRRQKNDAADAAAICEAVTRPSMRFVSVRSVGNQAALMHHKVRELLVGQRIQPTPFAAIWPKSGSSPPRDRTTHAPWLPSSSRVTPSSPRLCVPHCCRWCAN